MFEQPDASPSSSSSIEDSPSSQPSFELVSIATSHSVILPFPLWTYSPFLNCIVEGQEYRLVTEFSPELVRFLKDYLVWYHDQDSKAKFSRSSPCQLPLRSISIDDEFEDPFERQIAHRLEQNPKLLDGVNHLAQYFSVRPLINVVIRLYAVLEAKSQYRACRLKGVDHLAKRGNNNAILVATPNLDCSALVKRPMVKQNIERRSRRWLATCHPYRGMNNNSSKETICRSVLSLEESEKHRKRILKGKSRRVGRSIYAGS